MPVLLDTNIASFLHPRKKGSPERLKYEPHLQGQVLALSFQSVAELLQWAEQNKWGAASRAALDRFIAAFLIIPFDYELGRAWARVMTHARAAGRRLEAGDAWIAATALRHNLPLITHDAEFRDLNVPGIAVTCHA
jgi:tRNA(fMet)-specific endonuclease VapC